MSGQRPLCTCSVDGIAAPFALRALMHFPGCAYNLAMGSCCPLCYRPTNSLVPPLPGLVPVWAPSANNIIRDADNSTKGGQVSSERSAQTEVIWSQQSPLVSSRPAPMFSNTVTTVQSTSSKRAREQNGSKESNPDFSFDVQFPSYDNDVVQKKSRYARAPSTPDSLLQGLHREAKSNELKKLTAKFGTLQGKATDFFKIGFKEANQAMRSLEELIKQIGALRTSSDFDEKEKKDFLAEAKELEKLMREKKVQKEFLQEVFANKRKAQEYYEEYTSGKRDLTTFQAECDSFVDYADNIDKSHEEVWEACFKAKNDILLLKAKAERHDKDGCNEDGVDNENAS